MNGWLNEGLFYDGQGENKTTPWLTNYYLSYLTLAKTNGMKIFVVDYCTNTAKINDSYARNNRYGFISYVGNPKLDQLPIYPKSPFNSNIKNISKLLDAKNFFPILNAWNFTSKMDFVNKTKLLNHDVLIVNPRFMRTPFTSGELSLLKTKPNGSRRLLLCYMPINEVSNSSFYWQTSWKACSGLLGAENKKQPGTFKVKYWMKEWHDVLYGSNKTETWKLLSAGCDGALL